MGAGMNNSCRRLMVPCGPLTTSTQTVHGGRAPRSHTNIRCASSSRGAGLSGRGWRGRQEVCCSQRPRVTLEVGRKPRCRGGGPSGRHSQLAVTHWGGRACKQPRGHVAVDPKGTANARVDAYPVRATPKNQRAAEASDQNTWGDAQACTRAHSNRRKQTHTRMHTRTHLLAAAASGRGPLALAPPSDAGQQRCEPPAATPHRRCCDHQGNAQPRCLAHRHCEASVAARTRRRSACCRRFRHQRAPHVTTQRVCRCPVSQGCSRVWAVQR